MLFPLNSLNRIFVLLEQGLGHSDIFWGLLRERQELLLPGLSKHYLKFSE